MNVSRIFFLFIIIFLIKKSKLIANLTFDLPSSFTLLDNSILFVAQDGIHIFDEELNEEFTNKAVNFTVELTDMTSLLIAQFQNENFPYILLYIKKTIYIFNSEKTLLKSQVIADQIINDNYMNLVPYKKDNNLLYFLMLYYNYNYIILLTYSLDLTNYNNALSVNRKEINFYGDSYYQIAGLSCNLMPPYEPLNLSNDLLTCFYFKKSPFVFYSITYELGEEYTRVSGLDYNEDINTNIENQYIFTLKSLPNKNKEKILLYAVIVDLPFSGIFDYNNKLYDFKLESMGNHTFLDQEHSEKHKLYYFDKTKEFVTVSEYGGQNGQGCSKFIMVFHDNCKLNYKGSLYFTSEEKCYYAHLFTVFHNGLNYTIITNGGDSGISFSKLA